MLLLFGTLEFECLILKACLFSLSLRPYVPDQPDVDTLRRPPPLLTVASAPSLGALAAERKRTARPGNLTPLYLPETAHVDTSPRAFLREMTGETAGVSPSAAATAEMTLRRVQVGINIFLTQWKITKTYPGGKWNIQ